MASKEIVSVVPRRGSAGAPGVFGDEHAVASVAMTGVLSARKNRTGHLG